MAIKCINILQSKALQNLPKLGFCLENKPSGNLDLKASESNDDEISVEMDRRHFLQFFLGKKCFNF
jgi:hypothetical protein